METISSILKLVTTNMYFTNFDLKDAYYTIPISEEHQKNLKLANEDHLYKFTCLPNGHCHGPRKFTKALKSPLSKLRLNKITIATYLHDCLNMDKREIACWQNTKPIFDIFQIWGLLSTHSLNLPFSRLSKLNFSGLR